MPRGDRTGPLGEGPMTGLRRGYCADDTTGFGRGFGFGRGYRRGFGFNSSRGLGWRWQSDDANTNDEASVRSNIDQLKKQLESFENLLQKLKSKD